MKKQMVADIIIQQFIQWGIKRIYAVAGDTILHFFDRLSYYPEIQLITTRHESAAAFMASAEAKLTGHLAVCMGHNGPGVANLINGLGDAYTDRAPVLVLTGQVERWNMGTNYKQYIHQQGLLSAVTDFSELIAHPDSVVDLLTLAMRKAIAMGTVTHLVIPKDLFTLTTTDKPREKEPFLFSGPSSQSEVLSGAVKKLHSAQKPVILVGRGGIMAGMEIIQFAEKIGAGIMATLPARGIIPSSHPLNLGGLGHAGSEAATQALKEADLAIILGATWWPADYVPEHIPILQIDANPANLGSTKAINYGIVGKLEEVLPRLLEQIQTQSNQEWINQLEELMSDWKKKIAEEAAQLSSPLQPPTIIQAISKVLPKQTIIALDVGDHVVWFNRSYTGEDQQILVSGRWRSMGFGLPAAAAAKLVYPEREVILITGDGGLSMVLGELSTLVRYQLAVKIFVLNNESLAMEQNRMLVSNLAPNGVDLTNPDYAEVARVSGLNGLFVEEPEYLEKTLKQAIETAEPTLVDLFTAATIPPHTKL